jgi:molecular chaperone GrpE
LKIAPEVDLNELNNQFKQVVIGMEMTSTVMDSCLKRFNVVQFSPKGEKFNPNLHEAIFTIPTTDAS